MCEVERLLYSLYSAPHEKQIEFLTLVWKIVKPVYKGHSMEPENVAFISSCPLYAG